MAWKVGFNFRTSADFVTDVPPDRYVSPSQYNAQAYPFVDVDCVWGWENLGFGQGGDRNRNANINPELAGFAYQGNGTPYQLRVDIPSPGEYDLTFAGGEPNYISEMDSLLLEDGDGTVLADFNGQVPANAWMDATGAILAGPQNWTDNNTPLRVTLVGPCVRVNFKGIAGSAINKVAHFAIEKVESGGGGDIGGGLATTESRDVAAFVGEKTFLGALACLESRDGAAFAGTMIPKLVTGTFAATERYDIANFLGDVFTPGSIGGGLTATEARDAAAFAGVKTFLGTLAAGESRDLAAFAGTMIPKLVTGTLAATEARDVLSALGDVFDPGAIGGGLASTESRDTAAFAGVKTFVGTLTAVEVRDSAAFLGTMIPRFSSGTLAATERVDSARFDDYEAEVDKMGNTIAMRDSNAGIGISPEEPWKDGAPSWARDGSNPETQFPMAIGNPQRTDNFGNNANARQARLLQAPSDTPAGTDVVPGWFCGFNVKAGEWCWCISRTAIVADNDDPIGQEDLQAL